MARSVRLDGRGMEAIAKSDAVRELVVDAAERVADRAREADIYVDGIPGDVELPVKVTSYTTDRAAASVALAHPSGIAVQAKHGLLTRAAAAEGFEVRGN